MLVRRMAGCHLSASASIDQYIANAPPSHGSRPRLLHSPTADIGERTARFSNLLCLGAWSPVTERGDLPDERARSRTSRPRRAWRSENYGRRNVKFGSAFKLIWPVQMLSEKYSSLLFPKSMLSSSHPASLKRDAARTSRGVGCGMRWPRCGAACFGAPTYAMSRTVKSQGPGLPTLRSAQRVKRVVATVANKPGRRGDCV